MAIAAQPQQDETDYPTLFRSFILRSASVSLARVQRAGEAIAAEVRQQALESLHFALELDEAWTLARDLLLALARAMERAGLRDEWMVMLEHGIGRAQRMADPDAEAGLRWNLGVLHQLRARYEEAALQLEASAAIFERLGKQIDEARALNRLAYVARRRRRFDEAARLVERALVQKQITLSVSP